MANPFDNSGMGSTGIGQDPNASAIPAGGDVTQLLKRMIDSQATALQKKVIFPQQLPPNHVQPGDVSGNFVNPNTAGGPKHNARVSMAQSIGSAVSQAINRHEDKEARDLSFDIQLLESNINTMNDPNATPQEKQMAQQQLNQITSDKAKMKKIQKALNIQFFGGEDKRTGVEKKAVAMAKIGSQSQGVGQQQQGQQPMSESLGMPQGLNPIARQMMQRLPSVMGTTPAAESQMALTKAGINPSAKDQMSFAADVMQNDTKMQEIIAKVGIEQTKAMLAAQLRQDTLTSRANHDQVLKDIANAKDASSLKAASIRAGAEIQSATIRSNAATAIATGKNTLTEKTNNLKIQKDTIKSQQTSIDKQLTNQRSIITAKNSSKDAKTAATAKIAELEARAKELNQQLDVLGTQLDSTQKQSTALDSLQENTTFNDIWGDASASDQQ